MKKTILISGVKGFLASNLLHLLREEYTIYGVGKIAENWNGITVFSSSEIDKITIQPDYLILCHASISSGQTSAKLEELFQVNVKITEQLVQKFTTAAVIYISSASIYDNSGLIKEDSPIFPKSDYAISKLWGEQMALKNSNAVIIRLSSLFGIGMKENTIIPNYVNQALLNGEIQVWGKGERMQNYIHVEDVVSCINSVINNFEKGNRKVLLAVHSIEYSNAKLAQIIAEKTNAKLTFINEDHSKSWYYNNNLTQKLLNWSPKIDFKEAIFNYIQWKKEQF